MPRERANLLAMHEGMAWRQLQGSFGFRQIALGGKGIQSPLFSLPVRRHVDCSHVFRSRHPLDLWQLLASQGFVTCQLGRAELPSSRTHEPAGAH